MNRYVRARSARRPVRYNRSWQQYYVNNRGTSDVPHFPTRDQEYSASQFAGLRELGCDLGKLVYVDGDCTKDDKCEAKICTPKQVEGKLVSRERTCRSIDEAIGRLTSNAQSGQSLTATAPPTGAGQSAPPR